MTRISRIHWLAAGLETLAVEGVPRLTIDALTKKQHVTKGSFYHHFRNQEDFKNALLGFWEQQYTRRIVEFSESAQDPALIFSRFISIIGNESPAAEIAIRSWAFQDEQVRAYVQRIDDVRVAHARRWFRLAQKEETLADQLARLFNALLIGCYSVFPPLTGDILKQTIQSFLKLAEIQV